ncbi:MAG: hypothetical protein CSA62_08825 [Planctomycetota bacterium]|nr:MAG: hypothetical protein CSA62_08825 [Planctomycetota bacterium]
MIEALAPTLALPLLLLTGLPTGASAQSSPAAMDPSTAKRIEELADAGKSEEALKLCRKLMQLQPKEPFAARQLLALLLKLGRIDDALDAGDRSLARFPKDVILLESLALASQRKAEQFAKNPRSYRQASLYLQDAEGFAKRALKQQAKRRKSLAILGLAQLQLGKGQAALETASKLTELFPKSASGPLLRAQIRLPLLTHGIREATLSEKERFTLAGLIRKDCMLATRLEASRYLPYRLLGDVAAWLGEIEEARTLYASALARDPSRGAPHDWLLRQGAFAAHACYSQAIAKLSKRKDKHARDEAILQWYRGIAAFHAEDWQGTRESMARCYALESSFVSSLYYNAVANYESQRPQEALALALALSQRGKKQFIGELRRAGADQTRQLKLFRVLALLAKNKGDLHGSRELNHCIASVADDADSWNNHAFLCRETGRHEEAWTSYKRALAKAPKDPQLLNDAAVILQYHLKRDQGLARKMYQEAIRIAEQILLEKKLSPALLARAAQSRKDARGNLKKLAPVKQDKKERP